MPCLHVANCQGANPVPPFSEVYSFIYIRGCHVLCFDLPAPSPPGCDRPRPVHRHCPQAGGRRHTAAPEHNGAHANPLRKKRRGETEEEEGDFFLQAPELTECR